MWGAGDPAATVALVDAAGAAVPFDIVVDPIVKKVEWGRAGYLVTPRAPLQPGMSYTLSGVIACDLAPPDAGLPPASAVTFAAAAAPAPAATGTIAVAGVHYDPALVVPTNSGSCTTTIGAEVIDLAIAPDPALVPYLPTALFQLAADGVDWADSNYGGLSPAGVETPPEQKPFPPRLVTSVYAACATSDPGADVGLAPGMHMLSLSATVAGGAALPPAPLAISIACPPVADAGDAAVPADAAGGADESTGGGSDGGGPVLSGGGCGCRLGRAPSGRPLWLAALAGALWLRRRACVTRA
jgi:hypothetical protein